MTDEMSLQDALARLDHGDNTLWTTDGQPRLEAVAAILGRKVTRQEIREANPEFQRVLPDSGDVTSEPLPIVASTAQSLEELEAAVEAAANELSVAQAKLVAAQTARDAALQCTTEEETEPLHMRQMKERMAFVRAQASERGVDL